MTMIEDMNLVGTQKFEEEMVEEIGLFMGLDKNRLYGNLGI